jgi:hypothetical protein
MENVLNKKVENDNIGILETEADHKAERKPRPSPIRIPSKHQDEFFDIQTQAVSLSRKIFYFVLFRTAFNIISEVLLLINIPIIVSSLLSELIGILAVKKLNYILSVAYSFILILFIIGKVAGIFYAVIELTMPSDQSLNLYYIYFLIFLTTGIGCDLYQVYLNVKLSSVILTEQYKKLLITV